MILRSSIPGKVSTIRSVKVIDRDWQFAELAFIESASMSKSNKELIKSLSIQEGKYQKEFIINWNKSISKLLRKNKP